MSLRTRLMYLLGVITLVSGAVAVRSPQSMAAVEQSSGGGPVAEVTKLERDLEHFFNSPEYAQDPAAGLKYYDPSDEMLQFDIMQPGLFQGAAFRSHFIDVGKQFQGGKVEFLDLKVNADPQLAFVSMRQHFAGKFKDGNAFDMTMLVTDCLRKESGRWRIVREHVSIPLDIPTFMSVIKPQKVNGAR